MPHRLLLWAFAGLLSLGLFAPVGHAGSDRAVLTVTARVVHSCSVTVPPPHSRGKGPVDHRCRGHSPHRIAVDPSDPPHDGVLAAGGGEVMVKEEKTQGAAGRIRIVTITY